LTIHLQELKDVLTPNILSNLNQSHFSFPGNDAHLGFRRVQHTEILINIHLQELEDVLPLKRLLALVGTYKENITAAIETLYRLQTHLE
jgi:hypothetical protein